MHPRLASDWKWLGIQNLPYRGRALTYFAVRTPKLQLYANFHPQQSDSYQAFDGDISDHVWAGFDAVRMLGLLPAESLVQGHVLKIEREDFCLLELTQEV